MKRLLLAACIALLPVAAPAQTIGSGPNYDTAFPRQTSGHRIYIEFEGTAAGFTTGAGEFFINAGTGTSATISALAPWNLNDAGAVQLALGTVNGSDTGVRTHTAALDLGNGQVCIFASIREVTASNATNAYTVWFGFMESDTSPTRGAYFEYTHSSNGGEWLATTEDASVRTDFDTNIVFTANTSRYFKVCINAGATQADFYAGTTFANMALIRSTTTNVPTTTLAAGIVATRTASDASTALNPIGLDFMAFEFIPSTVRW